MKPKIKRVSIQVSANFFDNIFEKQRKKLQTQLGINNLSQIKFTEYLANSEAMIKLPKSKFKFSINPNIKKSRSKRKKSWSI
jgi:hypothetical protein